MNISTFFRGFSHAARGWKNALAREQNLRFHSVVAVTALGLGLILQIDRYELALVVLSIGLVMGLELVNSAVEKIINHLHPDQHPEVGYVKDVLAASVLAASLAALIVGILVFLPHLSR